MANPLFTARQSTSFARHSAALKAGAYVLDSMLPTDTEGEYIARMVDGTDFHPDGRVFKGDVLIRWYCCKKCEQQWAGDDQHYRCPNCGKVN